MDDYSRVDGETKGKIRRVPCMICGHETDHTVLASSNIAGSNEDFLWRRNFEVVRCGCGEISYVTTGWESDGTDWTELYPPRVPGRKPMDSRIHLPNKVRALYEETHAAFCNHQPILATVGLRALIEAICVDREKVRTLGANYELDELLARKTTREEEPSRFMENVAEATHNDSVEKLLDALFELKILTQEQVAAIRGECCMLPGEHPTEGPMNGIQEVVGSIPSSSTKIAQKSVFLGNQQGGFSVLTSPPTGFKGHPAHSLIFYFQPHF